MKEFDSRFHEGRPVVAWDIHEYRIYGAPGETNHHVIWLDDYTRSDGTAPDLDWLLSEYMKDGKRGRGGLIISIRPLFAEAPIWANPTLRSNP